MNGDVYYIISIFILFSIVLSHAIAEKSSNHEKTDKNLNNRKNSVNEVVVTKARNTSNNNIKILK